MKRIIFSIVMILATLTASATNDTTALPVNDIQVKNEMSTTNSDSIQKAIKAYDEGAFFKAISLFESELKTHKAKGLESAQLYYNLGNSYFRVDNLAKARLNYERALLLDPTDKDVKHNIDYITTRIEDKILEVDTIFLSKWFNSIQNLFSSDAWAILGVVFFIAFMFCLVIFFFSKMILAKKITFYIGLVLIIFVIFTNLFAGGQKNKIENRNEAIIMAPSVSIVSSPNLNSKELFNLHAGTKVKITKDDRLWLEIEIDNGNVGWIQREKLEII